MFEGKLKHIVLVCKTAKELQEKLNRISGGYDVKATQTHVTPVHFDGMVKIQYTAIIYYK